MGRFCEIISKFIAVLKPRGNSGNNARGETMAKPKCIRRIHPEELQRNHRRRPGRRGTGGAMAALALGFCATLLSGCIAHSGRMFPNEIRRASFFSAGPRETALARTPERLAAAPREPEAIPPPSEIEPVAFPEDDSGTPRPGKPPESPAPKPVPPSPPDAMYARFGDRFGIRLDGTENIDLLRTVDEWMGAPYRWGGCSENGVDCSCLVKSIYRDVYGLDLNRTVRTLLKERLDPVDPSRLREGDLLFFDMKDEGISHVGIYLKNGAFVHASSSRGVMINRLTQPFYRARLARTVRLRRDEPEVRYARVSLGNLVVVRR
jgi:probable lipoprotein NlpC